MPVGMTNGVGGVRDLDGQKNGVSRSFVSGLLLSQE
jgi:hypothetical protein